MASKTKLPVWKGEKESEEEEEKARKRDLPTNTMVFYEA